MRFTLPNSPELPRLGAEELARFVTAHPRADAAMFAVDHALTEHLQNIANHSGARSVEVSLDLDSEAVRVTVADDGRPFDPLVAPEPHLDLPLEERPVGGLGIHMMRRLMNGLHYERRGAWNVLEMTRLLESPRRVKSG